ncbi:MAG TPA: glycosyltransferase [Thermoplasmata archaeon]|nr:glycosyltransferase [Thermoplasmata archaeon]
MHGTGAAPSSLPTISVLITAHGRRTYLRDAVRSALDAGVPADAREVVVVKDFADSALDAELDSWGVRHIETDAGPLGSKLAIGAGASRGDVVAFLEDDDAFVPGRLAMLRRRFAENPALGFYRNGQRRIGPDGTPLGASAYGAAHRNLVRYHRVRATPVTLAGDLGRLARVDPDFNLSSIAVRRRYLPLGPGGLDGRRAAVDSWLFYAALGAGAEVLIESDPWTNYRVHPSNVSLFRSGSDGALQERAAYQRTYLEAFRPIYERLRHDGPRPVFRLSAGTYRGSWVLYRLLAGEGGRGALASDLGGFWREAPRSTIAYRKDVSLWGLAGVVAPGAARRAFLRRRGREAAMARAAN